MPNIITHKIFAEEILKKMKKKDIETIIYKYPQIYYIGSNGPDFLFFSHAKPWESFKDHTLNTIGSQLHAAHVNAFYEIALRCVKEQENQEIKEMMMSYLFGHLTHWALDKTTHPYIFYKTGNCKGASAGLHHRFESMMDTMMLSKFKGISIKNYRSSKICEFDDDILRAISRIYVPVAKEIFNKDIKVNQIRESLQSWHDIQDLLYDPNNIKYSVLKVMEGVIKKPWLISGNVVKAKIDSKYDVLNEEKKLWVHPCDDTIQSHASFMELFNEANSIANSVIEKAYGCIEYQADIQNLLDELNDEAYDTGLSGSHEFKYFDIIYIKGQS